MGTHLYPPLYPPIRRRSVLLVSAVVAVVDRLELALPRLVEQGLHMLTAHADVDRLINPHPDRLAEQLLGSHRRPVLAIGLGLVTDLVEAALDPIRRDFRAPSRGGPSCQGNTGRIRLDSVASLLSGPLPRRSIELYVERMSASFATTAPAKKKPRH